MKINLELDNLEEHFPSSWNEEEKARGKTAFLKHLSLAAHSFYGGKIQTLPKVSLAGFNWFNVWYTPGVSSVSTAIRDNNATAWELSNKSNLVAVVSDSTRVLGDGNCTPPGGLGVMEGKAFLMKYLGGVDAVPLCVDSRNKNGEHDPEKLIEFVKMVSPSFGAVNLEDISQPNCYRVLDALEKDCSIPVWHDDAQGTASVTLAGLINSLKLADKKIEDAKIVLLGAGAANTTIARFIIKAGGDPQRMIIFDSRGGLHKDRQDLMNDKKFYRKWKLCQLTNPGGINDISAALQKADVLIALSKPGPDVIKPEWIRGMAEKPIVFACANPVPEIYPHAAKAAGAFIIATGRGDFPNQVNNSIGFPGILKGALLVQASHITDNMAIAAAKSLAGFAEKRGINPSDIIPRMDEAGVFAREAADVAMQAIEDGVARHRRTFEEVYKIAESQIAEARGMTETLIDKGFIKQIPEWMLAEAMQKAIKELS